MFDVAAKAIEAAQVADVAASGQRKRRTGLVFKATIAAIPVVFNDG
jgi:hypothetical protein